MSMNFLNKMKGLSFSTGILEETKPSVNIADIKKKISDEVGGDEDESIIDGILDDISYDMLDRASSEEDVQDALLLFSEPEKIEHFFKYKELKTTKINNIQKELVDASGGVTDDNSDDTDNFTDYASDLNLELDRLRKLIKVYDINSKSDKLEGDEISKTKDLSKVPDSFSSAMSTYNELLIDILSKLKSKVTSGDSGDLLIDKTKKAIDSAGLTVININMGGGETTPKAELKKIEAISNKDNSEEIKSNKKFIKDSLTQLQSALLPESSGDSITKPGDFFNIVSKIESDPGYKDLFDRLNTAHELKFGENNEFLKTENPDVKYQLLYLDSIKYTLDKLIDQNIKDIKENKSWKDSLQRIFLDRQAYVKNKNLSRNINMSDFAGLSIKREIKIPLYKTVNIPITDEDIIANSKISKFRKAMQNMAGITGWRKSYVDSGMAAASNKQNKAILQGIASMVRGTAGVLGGEKAKKSAGLTMKKIGNALGTEIKDTKIKEDMVVSMPGGGDSMPGAIYDTPQSVAGGMDMFSKLGPGGTGMAPIKKKLKKKKKNKKPGKSSGLSRVLTFDDFLNK